VSLIRIAGIALGALAAILLGFLVLGFLLPSGWEVERSAQLDAPPEAVFPYLESAEAWTLWTPSPESGAEFFGPEAGEGSGREWDDDFYGQGEFIITQVTPNQEVRYSVAVEGGAIQITGRMSLTPEGEAGTRIVWTESGDFGWNPLLGYVAGRMDELQGEQLEQSLRALQALVVEGEVFTPEEEDRPPQDG
jgi:uncharacterized protein YndB with AHSA1/START domain